MDNKEKLFDFLQDEKLDKNKTQITLKKSMKKEILKNTLRKLVDLWSNRILLRGGRKEPLKNT